MLCAYVDEAGVRSKSVRSSDYFVMSAVVIPAPKLADASVFLAKLRQQLARRPGDVLHWRNLPHVERVHVSRELGAQPWATIASVVVNKRALAGALKDDQAYLYTLRYLLE